MTLEELITELRENILHDRSDRTDGDTDQMWSDAALVRYINEAQTRFARQTYALRDGQTVAATRITLVDGVDIYALHPSVLAVISAQPEGSRMALARAGFSQFAEPPPQQSAFFDPQNVHLPRPGPPLAYSVDETFLESSAGPLEAGTIRIYPVPDADAAGTVVQLRVIRTPIAKLTLENMAGVPEIPEMYHLSLLDWAAYLALRVVDLDAGMPDRAMEFRASFEQTVNEVRKETLRKRRAPMTWGFGRFRWER